MSLPGNGKDSSLRLRPESTPNKQGAKADFGDSHWPEVSQPRPGGPKRLQGHRGAIPGHHGLGCTSTDRAGAWMLDWKPPKPQNSSPMAHTIYKGANETAREREMRAEIKVGASHPRYAGRVRNVSQGIGTQFEGIPTPILLWLRGPNLGRNLDGGFPALLQFSTKIGAVCVPELVLKKDLR